MDEYNVHTGCLYKECEKKMQNIPFKLVNVENERSSLQLSKSCN